MGLTRTEFHFFTLASLLLTVGLTACAPEQISRIGSKDLKSDETEMGILLNNPTRIGFNEVDRWVFQTSCNGCHNAEVQSGQIDLSSYQAIKDSESPNLLMLGEPHESRLFTSLEAETGSRKMPPEPKTPLSEAQKKLVYEWIVRGAPKRGGEPQAFLSLKEKLTPFFNRPESIDYAVVKKWVFQPGRCYDCHSSSGYRKDDIAILFGADMSRYTSMFFLNGIVPGHPSHLRDQENGKVVLAGSRIFESVAIDKSMPPAREGFQPLSALRVKLLRLWILNCAVETYDWSQKEDILPVEEGVEKVRNCY